MPKNIKLVFLIIGVLVLALLAWQLFFNDGGIIQTAWNAVADTVNGIWQSITGGNSELLPSWGDADVDTEDQNLNEATW